MLQTRPLKDDWDQRKSCLIFLCAHLYLFAQTCQRTCKIPCLMGKLCTRWVRLHGAAAYTHSVFCTNCSVFSGFLQLLWLFFSLFVCVCVCAHKGGVALKHPCTYQQAHWGLLLLLLESVKKENKKKKGDEERKADTRGMCTHKPMLQGDTESTW